MSTRNSLFSLGGIILLLVLSIIFIPKLFPSNQTSQPSYYPTEAWKTSTPEEQGLDSEKLAEGLQEIKEYQIPIHSLFVVRNGSVVLDAYFYPYDGKTVHDLASVTKSVMTTLIGIAIDQGKLDLDQKVLSFFPDRTIANFDSRKENITIHHLASNSNGFESGCLVGDPEENNKMRTSPDWVQYALDRKMVAEPGESFCYDSPGIHLLSAILEKSTGMNTLDFAKQYLFGPLGITELAWNSDPQGYTIGSGDLYLKPADAAKLGFLWLYQGAWEGDQIVSKKWMEEATKAQVTTGDDEDYGYGMWISEDGFAAHGRGGQNIFVLPPINALVVSTGNGLEFDDVDPYLTAAFLDPENPLPPNPEGVAKLNETVSGLLQPPAPQPVGELPETAKTISGKTYVFGENPLEVETVSLEFNDTDEALFHLKFFGSDETETWSVGLDGVYRMSPGNGDLPQGLYGYWLDPQTFILVIDEIANNHLYTYRLIFDEDSLVIENADLGIRIEGQVQINLYFDSEPSVRIIL